MTTLWLLVLSAIIEYGTANSKIKYKATWESLDSRPLPKWYDDAKFGIMIHWGVYSVPSYGNEWFWSLWEGEIWNDTIHFYFENFMKQNYPPNFTYQDFARDLTAEFFNPEDWAELFESSGAKYVVLTSKHHEGYTLWPSTTSFSWNSMDVGPKRDLVGELATAIRSNTSLRFGLYYSHMEWFNSLYNFDKINNFTTQLYVDGKSYPELQELVENYKPEILWADGDWESPDVYWKSKDYLAWLYNDSPVRNTVVVNDRWGKGLIGKHGDFYTYGDRYNPGTLQKHKWENCLTIDTQSWGFRRNAKLEEYLTIQQLITEMAQTVSCGGNILVNVGASKEGLITPIYEERLRQVGKWLAINGEAIYFSRPWSQQNDIQTSWVWYTRSGENAKDTAVYGIVLNWPHRGTLRLGAPKLIDDTSIILLGYDRLLSWYEVSGGIAVKFPDRSEVKSDWAWVLKFNNITNL